MLQQLSERLSSARCQHVRPDRRTIITDALRKIDDLSARLEVAEKADIEPIAVLGMACRFPAG